MKFNFVTAIFLVATITVLTRFTGLDTIPPHLSNDEISIAYDAYSISKTLKDEHNHFLPLSFKSHSTYKAPLTIYLTIPAIIFFGNNELAARVPSALLGSLTILVLGLLVFELSGNRFLALLSAFVLAISPMHILTSHMAYESNIALFFLTLALYLFLWALRKNSFLATVGSMISFALSVYSYHTEWVFVPFLLAVLFLLNLKSLKKQKFYISILIFLLLITPLLLDFLNNLYTTNRASTENLLKEVALAKKLEDPSFFFWQKGLFIFQVFLEKYSSYFNLSYLFFTGYNLLPKGDPLQAGALLFSLIVSFLIGIYKVPVFFKEKSKFIYILLVTSPITASLTAGPQSTSRNLISLIPISIVCAVGIMIFWRSVKQIWKLIMIMVLIVSFLYFSAIFYYHFPKDSGEGFQYGYKQIALFIKPNYQNYNQIIIDPRFGPGGIYSGLPHLYIPYFTNLDPGKLQESRRLSTGTYFDKYQIRDIDWQREKLDKETLYVVPAFNTPNKNLGLNEVYNVTLPNFKPAFYLYIPAH